MTDRFDDLDELRALLDAVCEESATAEQMKRLEELVLAHPEAEAYYVQYMSLHADVVGHFGSLPARAEQSLRDRLGASPGGREGLGVLPVRGRRWFWGAVAMAGVAAAVLLAVALWPPPAPKPLRPSPPDEATDSTVAVLQQAPGAEWEATAMPMRVGAPLPAGVLRLKSGYAQLEFYSGATVILQGPAELKLISRTEAYLVHGKLRALVPAQAQGFTIGSPKLDLVDRGTEFGLDVAAGDKTEVHVFQGKVDLYDPGADRAPPARNALTTGQGVLVDGPGERRPIKPNPGAFLSAKELAARSQEDTLRRHKAWLEASAKLRQDPSLLVYYTFEDARQPWNRTLKDQAGAARAAGKQRHDGAIVGCAWGAGRWSGRHGLEFKRVSDRVRFHVPGEFESITLAAWVRVDGLPNCNNSLMMSDGWDEGEMHWQIGETGMLILGVQTKPKGKGAHYHAHGVMTPDRFGQWLHLAVVYDRDNARVTHYVDGRQASESEMVQDLPLRVGDVELGNWNIASHRNNCPVRHLSGGIDEFMMFSRALSDDEIDGLYKGKVDHGK